MANRLNRERELALKPGQGFWACVFEIDAAASDGDLIIRAVSQVDDFGRHLGREAEQVCRPGTLGHNLPFLPSGYGACSFVNVRAQLPTERWIDPRHVIEAAADTANFSVERQVCKSYVNHRPAGDIQKVLR